MARKRKAAESGGGYNWMDTYGDLVTLLLCFFVLLYSFSSVDSKKWQQLVMALSGSPREIAIEPFDPDAPNNLLNEVQAMSDEDEDRQEQSQQMSELYDKLQSYAAENQMQDIVEVEQRDTGIKVTFFGDVFFDSGRDEIKPEARTRLLEIAPMLAEYAKNIAEIRVEGHTDNRPIHTDRFPDNDLLSTWRAKQVCEFLISQTVLGSTDILLCQVGYGEKVPVASNDTEAGKARNRRVEFNIIERVILRSDQENE